MNKEKLVRESEGMLKDRAKQKEKVKVLINNPRLRSQEIYHNIMSVANELCAKRRD